MAGIRLTWDDLNAGAAAVDGFRIYRSDAPIDPAALPPPIATLARGVTSYNDPDGLASDYYLVEAYKGAASRFGYLEPGAPIPPPPPFLSTQITNLNAAWGTVLRVDGYTGPAIRVEDFSGVGPDVDLYFDSTGFVTAPAPYADTRVNKIYDQLGGGRDLFAPVHASNGPNPPYVPPDGVYRTARIGGAGHYNGFYDITGGSPSHPYTSPRPLCCISAEFGQSGGFRTVGGVRGSLTQFTNYWAWGGWQDNTYDGRLRMQIERATAANFGSTTPYVTAGEQMRYIWKYSASPAQYYLNQSLLGSDNYTANISYLTQSAFFLGGIPYNVQNYLVNTARVGFIEVFIQDFSDASVTDVAALDALMAEAKF